MGLADDVKECIEAWHKALRKYKADRPLMPGEDMTIARMVHTYGKEIVLLAFLGIENEPGSETFRPGPQHCRLARVFRTDTDQRVGIQYFLGIGAKIKNQQHQQTERQQHVQAEQILDESALPAPEEVQAFIKSLKIGGVK